MELVIFDVDGTLVYSERRDSQCFAQAYEQIYGQPFPTLDWHQFPHVTDTTIFDTVIRQHFDRSHEEDELPAFQSLYMSLLRQKRQRAPHLFREVPGAKSAVQALGENGERLIGVGTGGWQAPAFIKLSHVGIEIDRRLFSGADGKINREAILQQTIDRAEELNGGPVDRVIYIGDAEWDVRTTRNMQIDFIGVRRLGDVEALTQAGAEVVIQDYQDTARFETAIQNARPPKKI
jgi:phosphoglycolate phosphatase-like HAD superfamily hydrolase